jgi:hypothetical protein
MAVNFNHVTEGEFVRLLATQSITKVLIREAELEALRFCLVGIDTNNRIAYAVRHGRRNVLRHWRLNSLAALLKSHNVSHWEVQFT